MDQDNINKIIRLVAIMQNQRNDALNKLADATADLDEALARNKALLEEINRLQGAAKPEEA